MTPHKSLPPASRGQWSLLLLRLFLGVTFVYAGIQKLNDPQFFRPSAAAYIGKQIALFAAHSPLHTFLLQVAEPHAVLFGLLVIYGEIAIGFGMLFGFLLRPAAFFGFLLNVIFFLSATWRVYPYFYGSDVVFAVCWLALLINGPTHTGLPTFDELFTFDLFKNTPHPTQRQKRLARVLYIVLGVAEPLMSISNKAVDSGIENADEAGGEAQKAFQERREPRRNILIGLASGVAGTLGLIGLGYVLRIFPLEGSNAAAGATTPTSTPTTPSKSSVATTTATGTNPNAIAQTSALPSNSAIYFSIPATGDPGVLVHLDSDRFVAYDALCTHASCQVGYDPEQRLLLCPCHGAAFDPAKNAAVVQPPANTPLTAIAIRVDSATGEILLAD